jgi:hypothetical protein
MPLAAHLFLLHNPSPQPLMNTNGSYIVTQSPEPVQAAGRAGERPGDGGADAAAAAGAVRRADGAGARRRVRPAAGAGAGLLLTEFKFRVLSGFDAAGWQRCCRPSCARRCQSSAGLSAGSRVSGSQGHGEVRPWCGTDPSGGGRAPRQPASHKTVLRRVCAAGLVRSALLRCSDLTCQHVGPESQIPTGESRNQGWLLTGQDAARTASLRQRGSALRLLALQLHEADGAVPLQRRASRELLAALFRRPPDGAVCF